LKACCQLALGIAAGEAVELRVAGRYLTPSSRPKFVEPEILRDTKHPAIELCSRPPLMKARQGTLAGALGQIVSEVARPGEAIGKPPGAPNHSLRHPTIRRTSFAPF